MMEEGKVRVREGTHGKIECNLHVCLINVIEEASFLVSVNLVGQRGCRDRRHHCGQQANDQSCEAHPERRLGGTETEKGISR